MSLNDYHRKRDFSRTREPRPGTRASATGRAFVVQKHAARRLHYDLRLEHGGVLWSWAVPKGPSSDPAVRRLAVRTEDHPVSYAGFEGEIPKGQYGAGTVEIWDQGTWSPERDPERMMRSGRLRFSLRGSKLSGTWNLVRTSNEDKSWLLIKSRDASAHPGGDAVPRSHASAAASAEGTRQPLGEEVKQRLDVLRGLRLTHPGRVLYPEQGLTKLQLAEHYARVWPWLEPHVTGRLLTLLRCPEGHARECFFQKHASAGMPADVRSIRLEEKGKTKHYTSVDDLRGLLGLVQMGVLEIHVWGSRVDRLERPDRVVMDLDPAPDVPWEAVVEAALVVRERLRQLGLQSWVKTTGGKGLHVVVPLVRRSSWDEVKPFARALAQEMERRQPRRYVSRMAKAQRKGRIFVDYLRNGRGATAICPYSTRARPGAPVSVPLAWEELSVSLRSDHFTVRSLPERLASLSHDPWAGFFDTRQSITVAMQRELGLL